MLSQRLKQFKKNNPEQDEFCIMHLNYKSIKIIDRIRNDFIFIEQLYLNHNNLLTLSGIQQFKNLKVLHFRFNKVQQFDQLYKIQNAFFMKSIALFGNPLQLDKRCNQKFVKDNLFKNLDEFNPSCINYFQKFEEHHQIQKSNNKNLTFDTPESDAIKREDIDFSSEDMLNVKTGIFDTSRDDYNKHNNKLNLKSEKNEKNEKKKTTSSLFKFSEKDGSPIQDMSQLKINPFNKDFEEQFSQVQKSARTAKFEVTSKKIQLNETYKNNYITSNFINQQKQYLADAFYWRNLQQKTFNTLKIKQIKTEQTKQQATLLIVPSSTLRLNKEHQIHEKCNCAAARSAQRLRQRFLIESYK